jgi:hypothetical protein
MQHKFPDAVRVLDRMGGCHLGINAIEEFEHGVAMPGISIKGTPYLIGKTGSFRHAASLP